MEIRYFTRINTNPNFPYFHQQNINLRIGSAHYAARVWVNGNQVGQHSGGHLPFEMDISQHLEFWHQNTISIAINNTLNA